MFSPYYAWSGRRDPLNHCAVNVALYGPRGRRWAMTERGRGSLHRDARQLQIGPSALTWDGRGLTNEIDERGAPLPRRVRGRIRVEPETLNPQTFALADGHLWRPIAPLAHVVADFADPDLRWTGSGYLDSNWGAESLEAGFRRWTWSRARSAQGATILYDYEPRHAAPNTLAVTFDRSGRAQTGAPPPRIALPRTAWGIARETRSEGEARVVESFENTPFYARGLIEHKVEGEVVRSVHESLDLDRFDNPIVRAMLPFRMPRFG